MQPDPLLDSAGRAIAEGAPAVVAWMREPGRTFVDACGAAQCYADKDCEERILRGETLPKPGWRRDAA